MNRNQFYFLLPSLMLAFYIDGDAEIVSYFSFDETSGNSQILEQKSGNTYDVSNYENRPERIEGVKGNALRLDGYSTWARLSTFSIPDISDELAVEFWYGTESFNAEASGIVHQKDGGEGFAISISPYGKLIVEFYTEGQYYSITSFRRIEKYMWNHIVFQIDLPGNKAQVFVNGELWDEKPIDNSNLIDLNNNLTFIGCSSSSLNSGGFPLKVANGAIDELKFYNRVLSDTLIQEKYDQYALVHLDLIIDPNIRHADDYLRPRYHPMPNTSWTNEAYGFTYHKEKYHLFFQKNPNAPILNFMHWGHLSSPDLVNWTEEKIVLAPKEGFASKGVWSGTTFLDENTTPIIAYTGINGVLAGIGIAFPQDSTLNDWMLYEDNPIIPFAPANIDHLDFRDPYIWKESDTYYMVVGSGLQNNGGGILHSYTSTDLINWINIPAIYRNSDVSQAGLFWEMPSFTKLDDENYLLVVTPQFISKPAKAIYWIGSFDNQTFTPHNTEPKQFEHLSRHLLSPAIGLDEDGRLSYTGIIPEDREVSLQVEAGWRHTFSIPRVLRVLDDGETLGHIPHPNLCRARYDQVLVENRMIEAGRNFNLPEFQGTQSELYFKLFTQNVEEFEIHVFKNKEATQLTSITFDKVRNSLGINRILSSTYQTVENNRTADYFFNPNDTIEVHLFLDHSVLEVFIDNTMVMSARVYPSEGSRFVDIVSEESGDLELSEFRAWNIVDKEVLSPIEVCQITNFPDRLYTTIKGQNNQMEHLGYVFPNPAYDFLAFDQLRYNSQIYIFNIQGRLCEVKKDRLFVDISSLPPGFYTGILINNHNVSSFKFIKM